MAFASNQSVRKEVIDLIEIYKSGKQNSLDKDYKLENHKEYVNTINDKSIRVDYYIALSELYSSKSNHIENLKISKMGLKLSKDINKDKESAIFHIHIAESMYYNEKNRSYDEMEFNIDKAITLSNKIKDNDLLILSLTTKSEIKSYQGLYKEALFYSNKAKKIVTSDTSIMMVAKTLDNNATLYRKLKDYDSAIKSYKDLIKFGKTKNDMGVYKNYSSIAYFQITKLLTFKNNKIESLYYAKEHVKLSNDIKNSTHNAYAKQSLGMAMIANGQYIEAKQEFIKANKIFNAENNTFEVDFNNNYLSKIYFNLKEFDKAIVILENKINKYKNKENKNKLITSYDMLSDIHAYKKDYKLALELSKEHYVLYQIEFERNFKNTISEMNVIFDIKNKKKQQKYKI